MGNVGADDLGVGALSYAGQFGIMAVADRDACPDLDVFAAAARDELRALGAGCLEQAALTARSAATEADVS